MRSMSFFPSKYHRSRQVNISLPFPPGNSNCIFIGDPCDPDRRVDDSAVVDKISLFLARVVGFGMGELDNSSE